MNDEDQAAMRAVKYYLRKIVNFPATRAELIAAVKTLNTVTTNIFYEFERSLPNKTYYSGQEVINELGWNIFH